LASKHYSNTKKAATVSRSPFYHNKLPTRIEGAARVYPEIQEEKHQIKKGLPGCYIEIQATIEKKRTSSKRQ
jgi:hypothetical protein